MISQAIKLAGKMMILLLFLVSKFYGQATFTSAKGTHNKQNCVLAISGLKFF